MSAYHSLNIRDCPVIKDDNKDNKKVDIFNKRANEVMESWFIDSVNNGTITMTQINK